MVASGFQVISAKVRNNSSPSKFLTTRTAAVKKDSIITLLAEPQEYQAVADFKMITEEESKLRKVGGIIIGIATMIIYYTQDQNYSSLSAGVFAAISTYRTGADYQWGCIVASSWNIGSPFSFEKVPAEFQVFVKEKQLQIINNVLTSAVAGVVLANIVSFIAGDASADIALETTKAIFPILALVALASFSTTIFKKK